jgi:hypothetical protein
MAMHAPVRMSLGKRIEVMRRVEAEAVRNFHG